MNCMKDQVLALGNCKEDHDVAPGGEVWVGPVYSLGGDRYVWLGMPPIYFWMGPIM